MSVVLHNFWTLGGMVFFFSFFLFFKKREGGGVFMSILHCSAPSLSGNYESINVLKNHNKGTVVHLNVKLGEY